MRRGHCDRWWQPGGQGGLLAGAGSLLAGAVWLGPGVAVHLPPVAELLGVPLALGSAGDSVVLTFDDGPHPEGTPAVLAALKDAGATAVFFVVGERVERFPELLEAIVSAGHVVAVHAFRHRNQMRLTPPVFRRDLARAVQTIGAVAGGPPRLYRPPYGVFTLAGLRAVRQAGLEPLLWSRWGRDYTSWSTPRSIARLATRELRGGDVVLLHDADWYSSPGCHRRTAAALPAILEGIAARGLRADATPLNGTASERSADSEAPH